MLETIDFFQKEAQECRNLAAKATNKNDRGYWLHLAQRWEDMLLPKQHDDADLKAVRSLRPRPRPAFAKAQRFAKKPERAA